MTPRDPDLYTRYGLPSIYHADERTYVAIAIYIAYRDDPIFMPKPTEEIVRLVALHCAEYITSPLFTYPADELRLLRRRVVYIRTLDDLADWLWDCRRIMRLEPL